MQNKVAFSKDWKWVAIKDLSAPTLNAVVDGPFGSNLKTSDYVEKGVPVLQGLNITGNKFSLKELRFVKKQKAQELKRSLVRVGDLLVVKIGSIGYAAIIDNLGNFESALIPANLLKASFDKNKINNQYILHYLTSDFGFQNLNDLAGRTAQPAISLKKFKELQIPVPPISEQNRIAEILDTIDDAIQKTEALISKLKAMKQGLMHDLLTRGLDENGRLRDPKAHQEQFKESPLGRIPKDWKVCSLESLITHITSGSRGWASYYSKEGAVFLRIGNLTREHINLDFNDIVYVKPPKGGEGARTAVCEGDILISITADLGIIGVASPSIGETYVNQHIALVRIDKRKANPRWIGYFLSSFMGQKQFYILNDPGAKAGLNLPTVGLLRVALASAAEQNEIVSFIDAQDIRIHAEEKYRDKLKLQKKGLMHDLLTGKVRVKV
jgi:type I restriction enzyme S subunit